MPHNLFLCYDRMANVLSEYAKRMARLSARIFNEVARPTNSKSMKVVKLFSAKPLEKSPEIVEYYPRHVELTSLMKRLRFLGLYRLRQILANIKYIGKETAIFDSLISILPFYSFNFHYALQEFLILFIQICYRWNTELKHYLLSMLCVTSIHPLNRGLSARWCPMFPH